MRHGVVATLSDLLHPAQYRSTSPILVIASTPACQARGEQVLTEILPLAVPALIFLRTPRWPLPTSARFRSAKTLGRSAAFCAVSLTGILTSLCPSAHRSVIGLPRF